MSDGPHKCLPMPSKWKELAYRADNTNFSEEELGKMLAPALIQSWKKEIHPDLLPAISDCFLDEGQRSVFSNKSDALEGIRSLAAGSPLGNLLIDHAQFAADSGKADRDSLQQVIEGALRERANRGSMQMEEHYRRETNKKRASDLRSRLDAGIAQGPFAELATKILNGESLSAKQWVSKQCDIDDGVPL